MVNMKYIYWKNRGYYVTLTVMKMFLQVTGLCNGDKNGLRSVAKSSLFCLHCTIPALRRMILLLSKKSIMENENEYLLVRVCAKDRRTLFVPCFKIS